ncbi:MAG: D-alanyl-D-alanine dipeptidase [Rickettsiales bacterium]|jgi:D-alanyl-D-alanine dipeptidase
MKSLIPINKENGFDVEIDIKYATTDNFTNQTVYDQPYSLLHQKAADLLEKAIKLAKEQGFRFRIFDTYRPIKVQEILFKHYPDGDYVSDPKTGLVTHCRGIAVDLTLIDKNGNDLEMGTGFDEFGVKANHGASELNAQERKNRYLLMGIMLTAGFDIYRPEWWHYQLYDVQDYPIL